MSWPVKVIRWTFYTLFFLVPLIFLPSTSELFEFNKMVVVYALTAIIAGTWAIEMIFQKKFIFRRTLLDLPLIVFLISYLVSLLFSIDQRTSLMGYYSRFNGGLASMTCYALLYWAFVTFMDRKSTLSAITYSLLPTALLVSLYGVAQHFGIDDHIWVQDVKTRVFSTLGQPNWLAAYLAALIFIPVSLLLNNVAMKQWNNKSWFYFFSAVLLYITLLFTKSRSGLLAFGISFIIFWLLVFKYRGIGIFKNYLVIGIWILVILMTLVISNPIRDQYFFKWLNISQPATSDQRPAGPALEVGGTESGTIRKIVWTGAVKIWQASTKNFWLGSGPETFALSYYQNRPIEHNATSEWDLLYNKAHNEFLNYLATTGILGLGSYLILLISMAFIFFGNSPLRPPLKLRGGSEGALLTALLAGWISISITNFWGFSVVITNLLLFLLPALAIALNVAPLPPNNVTIKQFSNFQIISSLIIICISSFTLFSIFKYWLADVKYASGQKQLHAFTSIQEPNLILASYSDYLAAYDLNKNDPVIASDLSTVMAYISLMTSESDSTASAQLAKTSISLSDSAIAQSPFHPNFYKSQSRTAIILSTIDPKYLLIAQRALEKALIVSPTDPRIPYNLATVYQYEGDVPNAKKYAAVALQLKPDFADAQALQAELATSSAKKY